MNERIKEMITKRGMYHDSELYEISEAVIRECAEICDNLQDALDRHKLPSPSECANIIREYFGVN